LVSLSWYGAGEREANHSCYVRFGTVHLALQLVPGLSMFFLLTTAAGSALWAAKLEKKRRLELEALRAGELPVGTPIVGVLPEPV
jgi:hypothetical protein